MKSLLYILIAVIIGFAFGRYRKRSSQNALQNSGEALLMRCLQQHFAAPDYHLMNNVTLCLKDGTTQVDHILISRYGVFVIETKDYKGWIFGDPKQANWTQVVFKRKFQFQNPIFQNYKHLRAVQDTLDFLPVSSIESSVIFVGEAEFKTEVPHGVFNLAGFIDYVKGRTQEVMSLNRVQFCVGRLESNRLALTRETDIEHVRSLRQRYGGSD